MLYLLVACLSIPLSYGKGWSQKEEDTCAEGFGALVNFCGTYDGLVTKEVDRQERCSLLKRGEIYLKVLPTREVRVYFGNKGKFHQVGKLPFNAPSFDVDIVRRDCTSLDGVESKDSGCRRLNLEGSFFYSGGKQGFSGDYKIFDEGTLNSCRYSLNLNREL